MRRKRTPVSEPVVQSEFLERAKRAMHTDQPKPAGRCAVCGGECASNSSEQLCWVCRRLKISAWREAEQQMPAQE